MGHPRLRPGRAVSAQTAAQERYPFRRIAIFDLNPPAMNRSLRTKARETLLGCNRNQLVRSLIQSCFVSDERKQPAA